jgi:hypothetical protein
MCSCFVLRYLLVVFITTGYIKDTTAPAATPHNYRAKHVRTESPVIGGVQGEVEPQ